MPSMMRVNEKGTILISMLMLLVIVSILAIIALSMTSVELQVMGNLKKTNRTLNAAEGGVEMSHPVIEATLQAGQLAPSSVTGVGIDVISSGTRPYSLSDEILGKQNYYSDKDYDPNPANMQPNLTFSSVGGTAVYVDIDRLYTTTVPGASLEFASAYDGIGVSAGGGGAVIYYRIDGVGL